jgi:hypothetical protein
LELTAADVQGPADIERPRRRAGSQPNDLEQYSVAVQAHEKRAPVTFVGDIETIGQPWRVSEPSDFQILADPEDGQSSSQLPDLK